MAKTIPTTLALLILAVPLAHADTLLIDGIAVDVHRPYWLMISPAAPTPRSFPPRGR